MTNKKALAYNLFYLFLGQGASAILFFIAMAYLARTLGPDGFGIIGFSEVVFMFFLALSSLGIGFIGTREVAREKENISYYVDRILALRLLLGGACFVVLVVFIFVLPKPSSTKFTAIVYGAALLPASVLLDWLFQGIEKMYYISIGVFARAAFFTAGALLFIDDGSDIYNVAYIFLVSWAISSGLMLFFYANHSGVPRLKWDQPAQKKLLVDSWPIGVGLIVGWVIHYFDSTLLFLFKGEEAAGKFNAAYRPIILMSTALTVYFNAIFPSMSRAASADEASMKRIVNATMGGGLALMLPVIVLGSFLSTPIISMVYGQGFASSGPIFGLLLWWPLLVLIVYTYTRILVAYGRQNHIGRVSAVTAVINILLNLALIPFFDGVGASIAKIGADFITMFVYYRLANRILDVPLITLALCPMFGIAAMLMFMIVGKGLNILTVAVGSVLIYCLVLFVAARLMPGWFRLVIGENLS